MSPPIIILGGGNMGGALASRWHQAELGVVHVVETNAARADVLRAAGIIVHESLTNTPSGTLVIAIKPQQFAAMKEEITIYAARGTLVSIMAGVMLETLTALSPRAVRVMPNLPAMVATSMSVACAPAADVEMRARVTQLFEAVGHIAWVENETLLTAATAISGSGPGYIFAFMEALEAAAVAHGLDAETARMLVRQTLHGSALLATAAPESFATLRESVTSPGGVTQAALATFYRAGFNGMMHNTIAAAIKRSEELAD